MSSREHRVTLGLRSAGESLSIASAVPWIARLIDEGSGGALGDAAHAAPTLRIVIERGHDAFRLDGASVLTRDAWSLGDRVVCRNVCGSGFDLSFELGEVMTFRYRWRPPARERAAKLALRSRFHLLARAALLQYPAMWVAGTKGRVPLHAPVFATPSSAPLLAGPSGVGKSTILQRELASGALAICDNLSVADGTNAWGIVEPMRVSGGSGRRMPHGRTEVAFDGRIDCLEPDRVIVVRRGDGDEPTLAPCLPQAAARSLTTGTYMAGELRRYWAFASTLAAGTGIGPAHPPVAAVAESFAQRLSCWELVLPRSAAMLPPSLASTLEAACR